MAALQSCDVTHKQRSVHVTGLMMAAAAEAQMMSPEDAWGCIHVKESDVALNGGTHARAPHGATEAVAGVWPHVTVTARGLAGVQS